MTDGTGPAWLDEGYYPIREAASLLSIGRQSLRDWCHQGLIRSNKEPSGRLLACAEDVNAVCEHAENLRAMVTIDMVRRLGKLGKIGIPKGTSRQETKTFPVGALPLDIAMGLLQESMREALAEYGMLKSTSEIIVSNAVRRIEKLYDAHLASANGDEK